jgi:hypothetical protein
MGAQIPAMTEKPLATCGRKFQTTGWLIKFLTVFARQIRLKHRTWLKVEVIIAEISSWRDT